MKEVTWRSDQKRQPWFSKELGKLRRKFHIAEKEWLHCRGKKECLVKRGHYLEIRRNYKKAVWKTKRAYVEKRGQDMERLLKQPRKWWKLARKLEILRKTSANEHDLSTCSEG